jgi:hypothetical protein
MKPTSKPCTLCGGTGILPMGFEPECLGRGYQAPTGTKRDDNRLVTVCSECLQASCWQGHFHCKDHKKASAEELPIRVLRKLNFEVSNYWYAMPDGSCNDECK